MQVNLLQKVVAVHLRRVEPATSREGRPFLFQDHEEQIVKKSVVHLTDEREVIIVQVFLAHGVGEDCLAPQAAEESDHVRFFEQQVDVFEEILQASVLPNAVDTLRGCEGIHEGFLNDTAGHPAEFTQHGFREDVEIRNVEDVEHFVLLDVFDGWRR